MDNKKKIEVLVDHFYPVMGGLAIHCLRIYEILAERGWQVKVRTTKNTTDQINVLKDFETVKGIEIFRYRFKNYRLNPFAMKIDYKGSDIICMNELIILPHYFVYAYSYFLRLIGKRNFAVVTTSHGLFTTNIEAYHSFSRRVKRFVDRRLGVFFLNRTVDRIHAISQTEKQGMVDAGVQAEKIEVIPNGLDDEAFGDVESQASTEIRAKVSEYGNYMLQIGRLDRHKNFEAAIQSLNLAPVNVNLVILGPDEDKKYKKELVAMVKTFKLENRVIFAGVVQGVDKYYLMRHALLYIHMAHSEGFGMVVQEAMSQGAVCFVSKGTGLEEQIKDGINGYVLPRENFKQIADKIKFVLENQNAEEIVGIRQTNRGFIKNRTWLSASEQMEALFNKAIRHNQEYSEKN